MMRAAALIGIACAIACGPAHADDARANFVKDRDVVRLRLALEEAGVSADAPEMALIRLAAGEVDSHAGSGGATGRAALADVAHALHELDLPAAGKALVRADTGDGGLAGAWLGALVRMRRGDDAGAVGRLLAPPLFDWQRDAFDLALVGAGLPAEDRLMLAGVANAALDRAASRGRKTAIIATVLALAALDRDAAGAAFVRGVRALRRGGESQAAEKLFRTASRVGAAGHPALALEGALTAWRGGDAAEAQRRLAGSPAPAGAQSVFFALRRAGGGPPPGPGPPVRQASGGNLHADLIASLATAAGQRARRNDLVRWSEANRMAVTDARTAAGFLRARGLAVLDLAGDPEAAEAVLAAGHPFLLFRHTGVAATYRDTPVLVRAADARTGLWLVDEPDLGRLDVVPRARATKARMLCAVPASARAVLDALSTTSAARAGRAVAAALARADEGRRDEALTRLRGETSAVGDLYRATLLHRVALAEQDNARLEEANGAVERSRRTPPLLGVEEHIRGQALILAGKRTEGLAAYDRAERVVGPDETIALARYAVRSALGDSAEALAALDVARRLAPLDPRVLLFRGLVRAGRGDREGARADLRRALDRRPADVRVAVALAGIEREAGRPQASLRVLRETIRHAPALADSPVLRAARRAAEFAVIEIARTVEELSPARRSTEPETRRRLAFALANREAEGDAAEDLLRELLGDEEPAVRISTLRLYMRPWLRRRVEADAVLGRRVVALLEKDPESGVRAAAAALLARVEAAFGARALAAALTGPQADADPAVRGAAARALGLQGRPDSHAPLVAALRDAEAGVRRAAFEVLFEIAATTYDFDPDGDEAAREAGVARWEAWLQEEK